MFSCYAASARTARHFIKLASVMCLLPVVSLHAHAQVSSTCHVFNSTTQVPGIPIPIADKYVKYEDVCFGEDQPAAFLDRAGITKHLKFDLYRLARQGSNDKRYPLIIFAHANGASEEFEKDFVENFLTPALAAKFMVASVEFRHPISSFLAAQPSQVPNTDIAHAVQYLRFKNSPLWLDQVNVFLAGKSMGTLGIYSALLPDLANPDAAGPVAYQKKSSRVNAVFGYEAQTTYLRNETRQTFVAEGYRATYNQVWIANGNPPPEYNADDGSAIYLAETQNAPNDVPAMRVAYRQGVDNTQAVTQLKFDYAFHEDEAYFDIHDPNFGVRLWSAYNNFHRASSFVGCYDTGSKAADGLFGVIEFFSNFLTTGSKHNPDCVAGAQQERIGL